MASISTTIDVRRFSLTDALNTVATTVRRFRPAVVILIARKMPRLAELLQLNFGPGSVVVSDLAIPFASRILRGARVAIIDDLVNVGTTIHRAAQMATACGAGEIRLFAAGHRRAMSLPENLDISIDVGDELSDDAYSSIVDSLPQRLHQLAKPYDLEFPVIPCRLNPPYSSAINVINWLQCRFGEDAVHKLTPGDGVTGARVTLDVGGDNNSCITKLRFYFATNESNFNLVPISIPNCLSDSCFDDSHWTASLLYHLNDAEGECPKEAQLWHDNAESEPSVRANLFVSSLAFASRQMEALRELCSPVSPTFCSVFDGQLLFGPGFSSWLASAVASKATTSTRGLLGRPITTTLPFYSQELGKRVFNGVMERGPVTLWQAFCDLFDVLGDEVGASNPDAYRASWPFSKEEIGARPYLRLRIGPTFADLVRMLCDIATAANVAIPSGHVMSAMLDFAIDAGFVVPTITKYDTHFFRIYRKGEAGYRDRIADRVLYAWRNYGKPLSRTRLTKLLATLAFSEDLNTEVWPATLERGSVATFQSNCVDEDQIEVSLFLRVNGLTKPVEGQDAGLSDEQ